MNDKYAELLSDENLNKQKMMFNILSSATKKTHNEFNSMFGAKKEKRGRPKNESN